MFGGKALKGAIMGAIVAGGIGVAGLTLASSAQAAPLVPFPECGGPVVVAPGWSPGWGGCGMPPPPCPPGWGPGWGGGWGGGWGWNGNNWNGGWNGPGPF